jgi:hypothetical protein
MKCHAFSAQSGRSLSSDITGISADRVDGTLRLLWSRSHDEPLFVLQALVTHGRNTRAIRERLGLDSDSDASQIVYTSFLIAASCTPLKR